MSFDYSKNPTPTWSWYHTNSAVKEGKTFCHLTTTQCLAIDSLNGRQVPVADSQCLQHRDEVKNITTDSCTVCAVVCCVAPGLEGSVCLVRVGTVVRVCVCVCGSGRVTLAFCCYDVIHTLPHVLPCSLMSSPRGDSRNIGTLYYMKLPSTSPTPSFPHTAVTPTLKDTAAFLPVFTLSIP